MGIDIFTAMQDGDHKGAEVGRREAPDPGKRKREESRHTHTQSLDCVQRSGSCAGSKLK